MTNNQPMYRVRGVPVFQNRVFRSESEGRSCATGDVELARDPATGLISNRAFCPELMQYDSDYHNEQALSPAFQAHLQQVSAIILKHLSGDSLIEVGCGKGYFLEALQALGCRITGLDPAYEGSNPSILKQYFDAGTGLSGEGIVLRHVLEHVRDPVGFLGNIRAANGGRGKIYIEVPCFDWICDRRAWFDIFYEHVNYFRLSDFRRMFGTVYESGRIFGGQYIYAVADLATIKTPVSGGNGRVPVSLPGFLDNVSRYSAKVEGEGERAVGRLGSMRQGVIFHCSLARSNAKIDMAVDINPAKQGRFLPVTALRVLSPDAAMNALPAGSEIFVMNGNYLQEIKTITRGEFNYTTVDQ